jgi:hypothetical protein
MKPNRSIFPLLTIVDGLIHLGRAWAISRSLVALLKVMRHSFITTGQTDGS